MDPIKRIIKGLIMGQTSEGDLVGQMALTLTPSVVWEGETLTNRQYLAVGRGPWNMKKNYAPDQNPTSVGPGIRINGIVSGCEVVGDAVNNNVQLAAGIANVNGVRVTVNADTTNAITRGAAGKYAVSALCVDNAGTVSAVKGTDGDTLDLTGGYGGAGQKPLVATTLTVLRYIVTLGDSAAFIPDGDIYFGESANISYIIDPIRGGIILYEALPANHTGPVRRAIYASFYDLTSGLAAVVTIEDATLVIKKGAPAGVPSNDSVWKKRVSVPDMDWDLTIKKGRKDQFWVDKMLDPFSDTFFLKMKEDTADSYYYYGFGILNGDCNINMKKGPVSETLKFSGDGECVRA